MELAGQIGDLLSGVFTMLAFFAVALAAFKIVPAEMEKFRHQKRAEIQAQVAQSIWKAVFRFTIELQSFCNPWGKGPAPATNPNNRSEGERLLDSYAPRTRALVEAANAYVDAWGDADLFFPTLQEPLKAFWRLHAEVTVELEMHARELDSPGAAPDAWEKVFGKATQKAIEEHKEKLRRLLHEFAHVSAPIQLRTVTVPQPASAPAAPQALSVPAPPTIVAVTSEAAQQAPQAVSESAPPEFGASMPSEAAQKVP